MLRRSIPELTHRWRRNLRRRRSRHRLRVSASRRCGTTSRYTPALTSGLAYASAYALGVYVLIAPSRCSNLFSSRRKIECRYLVANLPAGVPCWREHRRPADRGIPRHAWTAPALNSSVKLRRDRDRAMRGPRRAGVPHPPPRSGRLGAGSSGKRLRGREPALSVLRPSSPRKYLCGPHSQADRFTVNVQARRPGIRSRSRPAERTDRILPWHPRQS